MYKENLLFPTKGRSHYRIPSVVVSKDGTVFAFCNDRHDTVDDEASEVVLSFARKKFGFDWEEPKILVGIPKWAFNIGSAFYDDISDTVFCSFSKTPVTGNEFARYTDAEQEKRLQLAKKFAAEANVIPGQYLLYSNDGGETWNERPLEIKTVPFVRFDGTSVSLDGSCHGSSHGIVLRHGEHKGRIVCPSRVTVKQYHSWEELQTCTHNNAIYSDDRGLTWMASFPVQAGTGEGTLIENADGSLTYNSRAYFKDQKRYLATSKDGGESWGDFRTDDFLLEESEIGCNASFLRVELCDLLAEDKNLLPKNAEDITLFVNPRADCRRNISVCVSFDGGKNWAFSKTVWVDEGAYSSLDYSKADGKFYLLYEKGLTNGDPYEQGIAMAEFDLEFLIK